MNAFPITSFSRIGPLQRESEESERWSPITHSWPFGIVTGANGRDTHAPGCIDAGSNTYGSFRGGPVVVTLSWLAQRGPGEPAAAVTGLVWYGSPGTTT